MKLIIGRNQALRAREIGQKLLIIEDYMKLVHVMKKMW